MGDRTYAQITYPAWADILIAAHLGERHLARFWGDNRRYSERIQSEEIELTSTTTWLGENECNYGEHPMQKILVALGIPFDNEWDEGANYKSGRGVCRRGTDGEMTHIEKEYFSDANILGELTEMLIEEGGDAVLEKLKNYTDNPLYTARPIHYVPPTPEQIDRIISLLCDGPVNLPGMMEEAA